MLTLWAIFIEEYSGHMSAHLKEMQRHGIDNQHVFKVNVWCGVIGDRMVRPIFFSKIVLDTEN